ncbi:MAG: histidinol-phosphate transaminase [Rhodospirillales bacterium]|nr:histidinol-phosphate transaminase [Rhodospirillales bacterium]MSP79976.1 histidinol-phosphate transaminase [Rhodospirillales bacterium]
MTPKGPTPRPGILDVAPYVGGESALPGMTRVVKLSSNENAFGPSPKAMEAYTLCAPQIHRYPDGGCVSLRRALAETWKLDSDRIVCGAGSDELIVLLARAYLGPGDEALYSEHEFSMYPIATTTAGARAIKVKETNLTADVGLLLAAVTPATKIVFLANPNNPTGTYLPAAEVRRLRDLLPATALLILDAAYAEFVTHPDYTSGAELVEPDGNVVMLRTFSKIYGLGGLRLGWAYCPAAVADVLNRMRGPFNVSSAAQAAGAAALADTTFTAKVRAHVETWREWTGAEARKLGLEVTPGVGNFVLIHFPRAPGGARRPDQGPGAGNAAGSLGLGASAPGRDAAAADAFLKSRGVIARRMERYGIGQALRVTIGREDEMRAFMAALADFVKRG